MNILKDKYNMSVEENVFFAKRNIVDSVRHVVNGMFRAITQVIRQAAANGAAARKKTATASGFQCSGILLETGPTGGDR